MGIRAAFQPGGDYQAYLGAFPSGVFAQMAKNRIASMESARTSTPAARRKPSP